MVLRMFAAFDNEAFTVASGSPSGTVGDPIVNNSSTANGTIFEFNDAFPYQDITLDDTSSNPDVFDDDEEDDHVITDGSGLVANGTEVESESKHFMRLLDDNGDPTGPIITITVFSQNGQFFNIWGMASDTPLIDGARYVKVGGSNNGDSLYDSFVPCFTTGARIATQRGEVAIEDLAVGDMVITRDNGMQEVRWIGRRALSAAELIADRAKRPVRIRKGSFGENMPARDMLFSPNHRVLLAEADTAILFGDTEVLASAKDLLDRPGVSREATGPVCYYHILFDRHETIFSDGLWTESFLPGHVAMSGLDRAQQREVFDLFPGLMDGTEKVAINPARRILRRHEVMAAGA